MESKLDQFREFVRKHPITKEKVKTKEMTWQEIYEDWILYGEEDTRFTSSLGGMTNEEKTIKSTLPDLKSFKVENIKDALGYVKKINPDNLNKTLNNVQKVIQIVQAFGSPKANTVQQGLSAFSDWWD